MNKDKANDVMHAFHVEDAIIDRRKLCRAERILIEKPGLYNAYCRGVWDAYRAPRKNPYPPGKRHDEWQKNYDRVRVDLISGNRARLREIDNENR